MHILVVDDSKSWVEYHCRIMQELFSSYENLEIDKAYSAQEAQDWIFTYSSNPYDIVITDLHMENIGDKYAGEWLVEQIQTFKSYYKTRIIICSAAYNIAYIAGRLNVDCLPKPLASQGLDSYKNILS